MLILFLHYHNFFPLGNRQVNTQHKLKTFRCRKIVDFPNPCGNSLARRQTGKTKIKNSWKNLSQQIFDVGIQLKANKNIFGKCHTDLDFANAKSKKNKDKNRQPL